MVQPPSSDIGPSGSSMKVLTFTTVYPNAAQPTFGIFVEQRLRSFLSLSGASARVVAPVPWFPFADERFGIYGVYARVPRAEERYGISVVHPRFPVVPKVGWHFSPALLYASMRGVMRAVVRNGYDFDILDSHWLYPDGVAAVMLGRLLDKPVVITARGNDVSLMPRYRLPRAMILWAARNASAIVTVCQALKDSLLELGVAEEKVVVLRNGVDLERFQPLARRAARCAPAPTGRTLISVGQLIERKGHDITIRALAELADTTLVIAGEGPEEANLKSLAAAMGVSDRVRFLGAVEQQALPALYGAADAMVLASSREGWANVLLESMACGTPVIATDVWGTPEVVAAPAAGVLMRERSAHALVEATHRLFEDYPSRRATRRYAERFEWRDTAAGQLALFRDVIARHRHARGMVTS